MILLTDKQVDFVLSNANFTLYGSGAGSGSTTAVVSSIMESQAKEIAYITRQMTSMPGGFEEVFKRRLGYTEYVHFKAQKVFEFLNKRVKILDNIYDALAQGFDEVYVEHIQSFPRRHVEALILRFPIVKATCLACPDSWVKDFVGNYMLNDLDVPKHNPVETKIEITDNGLELSKEGFGKALLIGATVEDNPGLIESSYQVNLKALSKQDRINLLHGCWN